MLNLLHKDAYIAITDIGRYFHTFPLAVESRRFFRIRHKGRDLTYARCPFGYKLCPYYCSTWSAEFKLWFRALGIETAHMVDDWVTVGSSLDEARSKLKSMEDLLLQTGFTLSDKTKLSQCEVLLGVTVDTRTMTMRFDRTQARGMKLLLQQQLGIIRDGGSPDHTTSRHIAGKLNWYSEVLQSGRLHLRHWWMYVQHGASLHHHTKVSLIEDTVWWITILEKWERGEDSSLSFPILSPQEILDSPLSTYVLQSDASGTDGFGFHGSYLEEEDQVYHSFSWSLDRPAPASSHAAELVALCVALKSILSAPGKTRPRMLVWISDSQSAVHSVNKGVAKRDEGYEIVREILDWCDDCRTVIVGLWVPREENTLADYLSHLSFSLDRYHVTGRLLSPPGGSFRHPEEAGDEGGCPLRTAVHR